MDDENMVDCIQVDLTNMPGGEKTETIPKKRQV